MSRQQRIAGCIYGSIRPARDLALLLAWLADATISVADLLGAELRLADLPRHFEAPAAAAVRPLVRF
jgi:Zn-dependent alcohol dehydrogenase